MHHSLKIILQKSNKILQHTVLLISVLLFLSETLQAKSAFHRYERQRTLQLLVGGYIANNIRLNNEMDYLDKDPIRIAIPFARIKWDRFALSPDHAHFILHKSLLARLDVRISYKGHAYKATGMGTRHKTIYGGVGLRILNIKLEALKDLSGLSDGSMFSMAAIIPIPLGHIGIIMLQGEIEFYDRKYVDYYFGVHADEATSERPAYVGKWATDYNFQLQCQFFLTKHWILHITPGFRYYDDTIYNSPTVIDRREYSIMAGFGYQF